MPELIKTPITADLVHGAFELERTPLGLRPHRLPGWAVAQAADPQLAMAESQTSGVRLAFRTTARRVALRALPTRFGYRGMPLRPAGVFELLADGVLVGQDEIAAATTVWIDPATGTREVEAVEPGVVTFPELAPGSKRVELWLPHLETLELVELETDAPITPVTDDRPRWVHHGSSISHGSNAGRPTGIWPVIAAAAAGFNLVNLGFGGSALVDPLVARTIRDLSADFISVKLGINVVGADLMRLRAFRAGVHGFLDTIRDGHPTTPLLVVSPIYCPIHEQTPGPSGFDPVGLAEGRMAFIATGDPSEVAGGKLTLQVVRAELARTVAERSADDPNLHHLDGLALYGPMDTERLPLPDGLHPDAATHELIGDRFARLAFTP